jgi:hypothetical protein
MILSLVTGKLSSALHLQIICLGNLTGDKKNNSDKVIYQGYFSLMWVVSRGTAPFSFPLPRQVSSSNY